ncbi:hypothetical protein RHSIM_Rhsim01G0092300 [Rhododendron simsii]|uniref:Endonuclease/exonuclease/phosphatase domain-containing protein n=1 Tax=Rhododendron simsii TaxID=118357 RepID=A0A834M1Z2_RHOSS|nr:hypothetical protein RHSIM_Rhsim01G0092300 [Rhododendron simsii]
MTSQALGDLVTKNRPSIVFLMETKNNKVLLETIRSRLGFDASNYVDPDGLAGGLALWWKNDVSIDIEISTKNIVHTIVTDKVNSSVWAASFIYGCPSREGRDQVWENLKCIGQSETLPWLCIGDFNEVLSIGDKVGGNLPSQRRLSSFHEMLNECGLVDLGFKGPRYTWRNNRSDEGFIMERIDMAFANSQWREMHDKALVFVEAAIGSDHNPLALNTSVPLNKVVKPFRFESFWTMEEQCKSIISEAWLQEYEGTKMVQVCKKLRGCKEKLKVWNRINFGDLRFQIAVIKDQLVDIQRKIEEGYKAELADAEKGLLCKLEDLGQKDALFWHQRSRIKWLQLGDKNSRFFHLTTIQRRQRNQVVKLKYVNGTWHTEMKEIPGALKGSDMEIDTKRAALKASPSVVSVYPIKKWISTVLLTVGTILSVPHCYRKEMDNSS